MMTLALMFNTADPGTVQAGAGRRGALAAPEPDTAAEQPCRRDLAPSRAAAPCPDGDALHAARLDHLQAALRRLMGGSYSGPTVVAVAATPNKAAQDPAGAASAACSAEQAMPISSDEGRIFAVAGRTGQQPAPASGGLFCLHFSNGDGDDRLPLSPGDETVVMLASGIKAFAVEREPDSLTLRFGAGSSITFDGLAQAGAIGVARWSEAPEVTLLYTPSTAGTAG